MTIIRSFEAASNRARLVRLLDRVTYGAEPDLLAVAQQLGYEGFVDWQLDFDAIDDQPLEQLLHDALPTLGMEPDQLAQHMFGDDNLGAAQRDLVIATMIRRAYSPRQLFERVVEFWSDHFNVPASDPVGSYYKFLEDRDMMRGRAMGRFVDLLKADARSPAMLHYLDNASNTAEGPNENYARELLELHTLGVDGGYSEADIKDTARVFTGWTIRRPAHFAFDPLTHDWGDKRVLGHDIPASGVMEGEFLLERLADHPSTARFLANKLARRFVADLPGPAVVDAAADAFTVSGGDIRATLRALLLHPEVAAQMRLKLKRPNEFTAGVLRKLQPDPGEDVLRAIPPSLNAAGQVPFGWPAPDGYPDDRAHWQSTSGFLMRFNSAYDWTARLVGGSPVLRAAAEAEHVSEQAAILVDALRPEGIAPRTRRIMIRYANGLAPSQRPAALAAWLLAAPEAQWR